MPIPPPTARNARIEANWPTITAKNKPAMVVHTRGLRILGLTAGADSRTGSQVSRTRAGSEAIVEIIAGLHRRVFGSIAVTRGGVNRPPRDAPAHDSRFCYGTL